MHHQTVVLSDANVNPDALNAESLHAAERNNHDPGGSSYKFHQYQLDPEFHSLMKSGENMTLGHFSAPVC